MQKAIDWNHFEKYFVPENNVVYDLFLTEWRQETKDFKGAPTVKLVFEVMGVNGEVFKMPKEFSCGGSNAIKFKPIIQRAEERGVGTIRVELVRTPDKRISVRPKEVDIWKK